MNDRRPQLFLEEEKGVSASECRPARPV